MMTLDRDDRAALARIGTALLLGAGALLLLVVALLVLALAVGLTVKAYLWVV